MQLSLIGTEYRDLQVAVFSHTNFLSNSSANKCPFEQELQKIFERVSHLSREITTLILSLVSIPVKMDESCKMVNSTLHLNRIFYFAFFRGQTD